jgi:translation initiation factor IF-3
MNNKFKKQRQHKINSEVRFPQVRLIRTDGPPILMTSYEASQMAQSQGLDLILINESQTPPIVKIENYNKFIYDMEKSNKEKNKNSNRTQVKEIQLSPDIALNDLNTKAKKGREFLEDGDKVKVVVQLKGRQKGSPERGQMIMLKFASILEDIGVPESMPNLESSKWIMMMKAK